MLKRTIKKPISKIFLQTGVGLVELLVSMLVGLFIMAGVVQMVGTSSQNAISTNGVSRIQENIRYAFSRLENDITRTGSLGCFSHSVNAQVMAAGELSLVDNLLSVDTGLGGRYDYENIIGGVDDIPAGDPLGVEATDTFTLRFADQANRILVSTIDIATNSLTVANPASPAYQGLDPYDIVALADCSRTNVFMLNAATSAGVVTWNTTAAPATGINANQQNSKTEILFGSGDYDNPNEVHKPFVYLYAGETGSYRYYVDTSAFGVSNNGTCSAANHEFCALFRVGDGQAEELVDGVYDMQVEYGHTVGSTLTFATANNIAPAQWNQVDRVRLILSFNSVESVVTQGNVNATPLEKTVTRTVMLFNQL